MKDTGNILFNIVDAVAIIIFMILLFFYSYFKRLLLKKFYSIKEKICTKMAA